MKPRITVITIGVDDLERDLAFDRNGPDLRVVEFPTDQKYRDSMQLFRWLLLKYEDA
jgi:hypothetical protein